jgi:hypothetical protein
MNRIRSGSLALAFVLFGAVVLLPQPAAGCTGDCVWQGPGCFVCVDTGQYTGVACDQSGPCGCFYVLCAAASPSGQSAPAAEIFAPDQRAESCKVPSQPRAGEVALAPTAPAPGSAAAVR